MHMSKVSIRDVAALAGVSTATVSHVINNTRYVKEETKRLVLKSIRDLRKLSSHVRWSGIPYKERTF